MDWHLWLLLKIFLLTFLLVDSKQEADLAQIKELPSGALLAEYDWHIPNAALLFQTSRSPLGHAIEGPNFLTSRPGYELHLRITTGRTNPIDGLNYFGLWFSVIPGPYDKDLQWPFPYPVNLTLVTRNGALPSVSAVLGRCRPTTRDKQGCGRAFLVPHEHVLEGSYFMGGSLLIRASVLLDNKDLVPKKAKVFMRNQQLVSEFLWQVDALPSHESPVSSPPFQLDNDGYLLQLQLTLSAAEGVGLFAVLLHSDHDASLAWPFSIPFELALLDRKGSVDPEVGATCPKAAFNRPHPNRPNPPCGFRRMGPLGLLEARTLNGSGAVARFTAVLDQMPQVAGPAIRDQQLVAEFIWRVPHIERKLQLAQAGRLSHLLSERFYSSAQGYLLQMQVKFQNTSLGLYLRLLEGRNDASLKWPFDRRFHLLILDPREGVGHGAVSVDPMDPRVGQEACSASFWRPLAQNDACGSANALSYDQLYEKKLIRYGAILLKAIIYLEEVLPPRFATLTFQENYMSARFEWLVPDLPSKISQFREGQLAFLDSDKFYLSNNGYRMMLRLYPEKARGFVGLYAVLTRGAYDAELRWPFPHAYSLEASVEGRPPLRRTTRPGHGCPNVAFQRPDRELSEWSCGEGHMVAHETLLGPERQDGPLPLGVRFAITVFLQELLSPVASLRLEGSVLVAKYSWILKDATANLGLLKSREKDQIESPVFYTENQGYAMRLALSLSREQLIGLHWSLQVGPYDDALQWPFISSISLSLETGTTSLVRLIDRHQCPIGTFDRPTGPGQYCGFPTLITLTTLFSEYIQRDMVHIKASISLS